MQRSKEGSIFMPELFSQKFLVYMYVLPEAHEPAKERSTYNDCRTCSNIET